MHLLESLLCGPVLSTPPSFPQHVTILSTSSSSMACIIRHRRRRGAPQKEAGAHTKTFAFWHLIRVVIARQRKPPAPRYLTPFYRRRLKRASKCQLLTAEKRADLPGATSLFRPRPTSGPPLRPLLVGALQLLTSPSFHLTCQLTCLLLTVVILFLSPALLNVSLKQQLSSERGGRGVLKLTQTNTIIQY